MSDIELSWFDVALLAPVILPWLALPAAVLGGYIYYRRVRNLYASLGAAALSGFVVPWACLLAAHGVDRARAALARLGGAGRGALLLGAAVVIVALVLLGVSRAGSRRRAGS
jgi:hypothetical protein